MLQRMSEDTEYIELLSLAGCVGSPNKITSKPAIGCAKELGIDLDTVSALGEADASILRLMLVASFAISNYSRYISSYSSTEARVGKPFNPLLGETFELVNAEKEFRYVSEQVTRIYNLIQTILLFLPAIASRPTTLSGQKQTSSQSFQELLWKFIHCRKSLSTGVYAMLLSHCTMA